MQLGDLGTLPDLLRDRDSLSLAVFSQIRRLSLAIAPRCLGRSQAEGITDSVTKMEKEEIQ